MLKRFVAVIMIVITLMFFIMPEKVNATEAVMVDVTWDVIATLITVMSGYEMSTILTDNESEYVNPNIWVPDESLTQEKIDFVIGHNSIGTYRMTDEKAQEFWRNINKEEFGELRNLYNSNRNPDFYSGDGLNMAVNLNLFKDIFKHFRDKVKLSATNENLERKLILKGMWEGKEITIYSPTIESTDKRYAIYLYFDNSYNDRYRGGCLYYDNVSQGIGYLPVYSNDKNVGGGYIWLNQSGYIFTDGPVFNSYDAAKNYLMTGSLDDAINKEKYVGLDTIPSNFKPNTKTVLPNEINEVDELRQWIMDLITPVMPSTQVVKIIGGEEIPATGIYDLEPDKDEDNYFTIIGDIIQWLQKIYNFIISIPDLIIEWLKKIYDFLVGLPEALINGIKNLLEWLFVPDTVALLPMVDLLRDKINNSISIATYPVKIILNLFDKLTNLSASECILIFPELNFMGKKLNDKYVFNFTQFVRKDEYKRIYKIYRSFTSFIMILAVLTTAMKKFNENLKG